MNVKTVHAHGKKCSHTECPNDGTKYVEHKGNSVRCCKSHVEAAKQTLRKFTGTSRIEATPA